MERLSEQQVRQFERFGFLGFPGLLKDRVEKIIKAFEQVFVDRGGGHNGQKHDGTARSCIVPFIDQSEYLSSLIDDPRIEGIAVSLLGEDYNYMGSDGNYYVGDTGWHSDGWENNAVKFIKMAIYLDPLTRDTGALRVVPGSHQLGTPYADALHKELSRIKDTFGISGAEVPAQALETQPGDVVVFNHRTKHASFGGGKTRRMFTINACQRFPEEKLPLLKSYIAEGARFWVDEPYGPAMIKTATPSRMAHLEQGLANSDLLKVMSAKARLTMKEPSRG